MWVHLSLKPIGLLDLEMYIKALHPIYCSLMIRVKLKDLMEAYTIAQSLKMDFLCHRRFHWCRECEKSEDKDNCYIFEHETKCNVEQHESHPQFSKHLIVILFHDDSEPKKVFDIYYSSLIYVE